MTLEEKFQQLTCTANLRADLKGNSIRAVASTGGASAADFIIRFVSTAILARLLLPEQFGLVMIVTAVMSVADQFREMGLSAATVQKPHITHQEVSNLFWINVAAGVVMALIVCALAPALAAFYNEPRLTAITCALSTTFVFGGLLVQHQALLTRQLRMGQTARLRVLSSVISTLIAIYMAWAGFGYWSLIWREITKVLILAVGVMFCFPWVPSLPSRKTDVRSLLGFGGHLTAANIIASISSGIDRFLIGRFWGPSPVGIYRQAYQLIIAPMDQLVSPIFQVAQPVLSLLQNEPKRYLRFYSMVLTAVSVWAIPGSLFAAVYATEITEIVLGPKWTGAAPIFFILCFGAALKQPIGSAAYVLITTGRSNIYLRFSLLHNITLIVLMGIGVHWGLKGVAIADVLTTYLLAFPKLFLSFKNSPVTVRSFLSVLSRPAAAAISMSLALLLFRSQFPGFSNGQHVIFGSLIAVPTFFATWLLLPNGKSDLQALAEAGISLLKKRGLHVLPKTAIQANS